MLHQHYWLLSPTGFTPGLRSVQRDICKPGSCRKAHRNLGGEKCPCLPIQLFFFFTSVALARSLLEKRIFSIGTIVRNRKGFPSDLKNTLRLSQGEYLIRYNWYYQL